MMKIRGPLILILATIFFIQCKSYIQKQKRSTFQIGVIEERIEFNTGNDTLVGYLKLPETDKPSPVIVVLHSASHGHHDNPLYNNLEEIMNGIGVGVFTYDRRGSGESGGEFSTASLETLAYDGLAAIKKLRERKDIDSKKIGLYGISQGGWLGPLAFSMRPDDISFMILVSSSGVSPARQMEFSAITTLKLNGYSDSIISIATKLRKITNEYYRGNTDRIASQNIIELYRQEAWYKDVYLPMGGYLPEEISESKWIHEMDFNPQKYFESVNVPIALFYGQTDRWVPVGESIDIWQAAFSKNVNSKFNIFKINNSGHMMIINEDNDPKEGIDISRISSFNN